jgi:hypothetical protein
MIAKAHDLSMSHGNGFRVGYADRHHTQYDGREVEGELVTISGGESFLNRGLELVNRELEQEPLSVSWGTDGVCALQLGRPEARALALEVAELLADIIPARRDEA